MIEINQVLLLNAIDDALTTIAQRINILLEKNHRFRSNTERSEQKMYDKLRFSFGKFQFEQRCVSFHIISVA